MADRLAGFPGGRTVALILASMLLSLCLLAAALLAGVGVIRLNCLQEMARTAGVPASQADLLAYLDGAFPPGLTPDEVQAGLERFGPVEQQTAGGEPAGVYYEVQTCLLPRYNLEAFARYEQGRLMQIEFDLD